MHIFQSTLRNIIGDELNVLRVFDVLSQSVFIIDSDGKCIYANPACERQFGFTKRGKLIGKNLEQVIDQNVPEGALKSEKRSRIEQVVPNNERIYVENKLILRPDSTTFLADYWSYPIKRDGRPMGNLIILNEVGDRLDIHQQLAELARFPDMNPGPVLQIDLAGNIIRSNSAARDLFSSKLEICCWQDICPGLDEKTWKSILKAELPISIERLIGDKTFIFSHRNDSESGHVFVFGTDITEQKRAEKEFRETDELIRSLLNSTVEGIYGIGLDGKCTFANAACIKLLGFESVDEFHGKEMHKLVHRSGSDGDIRSFEESHIYRALSRQEGAHVNDEMMFRKDNSTFPAEYWSYPIKQEGKIIGCVVTFMDVTNRRQAEQLQSDYTSALTEIARFPEMNPGPVLRLDATGKVLMANKAAHTVFVKPVNQFWKDMCPDIDNKIWTRILKTKTVVLERQIGNQDYIFTHRRDFEGNSIFVFGANITEQKQVEWALQQTEKMASLGRLSAGLAHELNNPASAAGRAGAHLNETLDAMQAVIIEITKLNIDPDLLVLLYQRVNEFRKRSAQTHNFSALEISDREEKLKNWLELRGVSNAWEIASTIFKFCVEQKDLDYISSLISPDILAVVIKWLCRVLEAYELADNIINSTRSISSLVNIVKSYSHMGSAPEKFVDVHTGIDDALSLLAHKMNQGIEIIKEYDRNLPQVQVQSSELNQVWTSIIDNAVYAINGTGKIVIKTFKKNKWLIVQIKDTGTGIPVDIQSQIFDPFFSTKAPGDGTGLSLSLSHNIIVQKHKGKLSVKSVPGETCFEIKLPLKK
jgi:PAS domain S-box-containing protein